MIVFGGFDNGGSRTSSLLEYDSLTDSWSFPTPTGPAARAGHMAVWDASFGTMLVCCGRSASSERDDLWSYDGQAWTELSPTGSVTGRRWAATVYEPVTRSMMGFGGRDGDTTLDSVFMWHGPTSGVVPSVFFSGLPQLPSSHSWTLAHALKDITISWRLSLGFAGAWILLRFRLGSPTSRARSCIDGTRTLQN